MKRFPIGGILAALVFVVCVATIVIANQTTGWPNLIAMLLALAGLIGLLAAYNRKYR